MRNLRFLAGECLPWCSASCTSAVRNGRSETGRERDQQIKDCTQTKRERERERELASESEREREMQILHGDLQRCPNSQLLLVHDVHVIRKFFNLFRRIAPQPEIRW